MGTTTCMQIDLNKLFKNGFSTGHGHLREPKDIMSPKGNAIKRVRPNILNVVHKPSKRLNVTVINIDIFSFL